MVCQEHNNFSDINTLIEDLTTQIYIACVDKLTSILKREAADVLCGAISLLGLMAAVGMYPLL